MRCLKCGKETDRDQVFCDHCLRGMDAYPVEPGTHIHLPRKATDSAVRKSPSRKRVLSPEENVERLKKVTIWLASIILVLSIALAVTAASLVLTGQALQEAKQTGKNFTVEATGAE